MRLTARQMTTIAMVVACAAALGYLLLTMLPLPGMKFALLAPLLAMMMGIPLSLIRERGVLLLTAAVLAAVMSMVSLFMGVAIVLTGLVEEALALLFLHPPYSRQAVRWLSATFPTLCVVVTALMAHFALGAPLLGLTWTALLPLAALTQLLGAVGFFVTERLLLPRIAIVRQRLRRE
ncbi:MAG: hypothetical protein DDT37_00270 [Firmicutes bacterium]|nr:hypothetical protein [candidate division NPL-UPA2 bacterium]MBT9154103.1 hypothetical protein [candidate division NPL-UPA2 bacterium]MBT9155303.1 hypothetical protein [candidate division NPL-UPA2 bacterium]